MSKQDEAGLILRLYELRREDTMRKAREWYVREFDPQSLDDFNAAMFSHQGGYLRMVMSYWDMAAALVHSGAISIELFDATNQEHLGVFARVEPFLSEIRQTYAPMFAVNLEKLIDQTPNGRAKVAGMREGMNRLRDRFVAYQRELASVGSAH
jgi:hypothetical protein